MNSPENTTLHVNPKEVSDKAVQEPTAASQMADSASPPETALSEIEQESETECSGPMHSEGTANK